MTYLWINPVSERMISVEALERMLEKHDLTRVVCRESWARSCFGSTGSFWNMQMELLRTRDVRQRYLWYIPCSLGSGSRILSRS